MGADRGAPALDSSHMEGPLRKHLAVRAPCREECSLGLALKTLAGKVSMQLSQASFPAYWCQSQKEGQENRGHAGQLYWHPKDPWRIFVLALLTF